MSVAYVRELLEQLPQIIARRRKFDLTAVEALVDITRAIDAAKLSPRERQCVALVFAEGMTQTEAAQTLGITQPRVHKYLSRAIAKIARKERLYDEYNDILD